MEAQTFTIKDKDLIPVIEAYRVLHHNRWIPLGLRITGAKGCEGGVEVTVEPIHSPPPFRIKGHRR
jgi:hypothetical protein